MNNKFNDFIYKGPRVQIFEHEQGLAIFIDGKLVEQSQKRDSHKHCEKSHNRTSYHRQIGRHAKGNVSVEVAAFIAGACWARQVLVGVENK